MNIHQTKLGEIRFTGIMNILAVIIIITIIIVVFLLKLHYDEKGLFKIIISQELIMKYGCEFSFSFFNFLSIFFFTYLDDI